MNRIVTGNASSSTPGKEPVVKILFNGQPTYTDYGAQGRVAQLWQTHGFPTNLQGEKDESEGADPNTIVVEDGSNMRWGELLPGTFIPMHRTASVDYAIVTHGTVTLVTPKVELDLKDMPTDPNDPRLEHTEVHQGDVIVQRGTMHGWLNKSQSIARMVGIILPAEPYKTAEGKILENGFWGRRA